MSKKGFKYKGQHWTQKPENRERLIAMNQKTGKRPKRGRPKKQHVRTQEILSKAEKLIRRTHRKKVVPNPNESVSIVLNGWQLTLGVRSIRIEQE